MNVVIYARYSSTAQRDTSIEIQLKDCRKYCEDNGYTVIKEYVDRAKSGTNDNRPDFQHMIADSSKKAFECVIVYRFNRFARSRLDSVIYKTKLKKNGVRVLSVHEQIPDDPTGVLLETFIEGMDEFYSLELRQKVIGGMDSNGAKCLSTGGNIALGFKVGNDKHFEVDPETAPIVQMIFEMYAGGKTVTEITTHLNSLGYKTSRGVPFNKNSLHTMLKNKRYIGVYTYKGTETPGGMPRIISDELFHKVAEIMAKNKKAPARSKAKVEYLLTTKLFCGHCKEMMTGFSATGKQKQRYNYYICNGRKNKQCDKKMVKKDYIENLVITQCRKLLTPSNIEKIATEVAAICEAERDTSNLRYLKKCLSENERKSKNAMNAVVENDNPSFRKNIYEKISQLESEHEQLRKAIAAEEAPFPSLTAPKIKFFLTSLKKGNANDIKYRRALITIFVNRIYLYDDRITITFNSGDETVTINDRLLSEIEEKDMRVKNLFLDGDGPPKSKRSNTVQIRSIAVYKSTFGIVLDTSGYGTEQSGPDCPPTYAAIQRWIEDNHGVKVSKSSVTMVKDKCGASKLDFKAGKEPESGIIKTTKEKLVLEAFRALGVV